nr:aminotransferase class III-fold pyridoxal phosphate-dependent enzyme [Actinomycetota bacterium]
GVRGAGLLLGIGLTAPKAADLATAARVAGFLVNPVQPDTVRLAPPLVLTDAQAQEFLTALPGLLDQVQPGEVLLDEVP